MASKRKWLPLRVIASNILYKLSDVKAKAQLAQIKSLNGDLVVLMEVAKRAGMLLDWSATSGMLVYQPHPGSGTAQDTALAVKASRFKPLWFGYKAMTKEPPGVPTKRYCSALILWDKASHCFVIFMGTHTLAAVERKGVLNKIARTPFYVQHIFNLVVYAMELRKKCKKEWGGYGQVVVGGDLNWDWSGPTAWINKALNGYFTSCHIVLGRVATLGRRAVDVVLKRGNLLKFIAQRAVPAPSDHDILVVDMSIGQVAVPASMKGK